jgi:DNA repair photolyase
VEALTSKNVPVIVRVDPIIPSVNDHPDALFEKLGSLGVKQVTVSTLKVDRKIFNRIRARLPDIAVKLEPLYFGQGERAGRYVYLPKIMRLQILERVKDLAEKHHMRFGVCREGLSQLNTATCDGSWLFNRRSQKVDLGA